LQRPIKNVKRRPKFGRHPEMSVTGLLEIFRRDPQGRDRPLDMDPIKIRVGGGRSFQIGQCFGKSLPAFGIRILPREEPSPLAS
jgi:hypothetical protein